jgi:VRR-NUC domain
VLHGLQSTDRAARLGREGSRSGGAAGCFAADAARPFVSPMRWSEADLQSYLKRRGTIARPAEPPRLRRPVRANALSEEAIQRAVFAHIRTRGALDTFAFHPRNSGRDQRHLAGINSGLGVVSGVPDVVVIKGGRVFALELKTERGRLSPDQLKVHDEMRAAGCEVAVAYGLDQAVEWLEARGILRGSVA